MSPSESPEYIPIADVPQFISLKRNGKRLHKSTVWRWVTKGVRGNRLQTWYVGGIRCTTRAALDEFIVQPARDADTNDDPVQRARTVRRNPLRRKSDGPTRKGAR